MQEIIYRFKKSTKNIARKILYFPLDFYNFVFRHDKDTLPPVWKNYSGDGDFQKIGNEFFKYFTDYKLINSKSKILDVGCGIGRMAIPLTKYLDIDGIYEGFDIMKESITWCQKNISKSYPNFNFHFSNIYNKEYNPGGKYSGSDYKFPFEDNHFDFVFLTSVFTHMMPLEVENYIKQISRVLNKGGRSFVTFFVLNNESKNLLLEKKGSIEFNYHHNFYWVKDDSVPEAAIAYEENYIRDCFGKNNLKIVEPILWGSFCGRNNFLSYQDIIICEKF